MTQAEREMLREAAEDAYTKIRDDHNLRDGFNLPWHAVSEDHKEAFEMAFASLFHAGWLAGRESR